MAKQTYSIKAGSIASIANIIVAGETVCQAVYIEAGRVDFDPMYLPQDVREAVEMYFRDLYAKGPEWINSNFDKSVRFGVALTIVKKAAKNIAGTMVDLKFPDGWKSGYFVQEITAARPDVKYAITAKTAGPKPETIVDAHPDCVRVSARCA